MGKIVFWLVVVFLVLFVLRMINVSKTRNKGGAPGKSGKAAPEAMVRCAQCGVFLPKPEARETAAGYRCNDPACMARH
ncbi:MAG: PP0621 family protein [Burkholderiales bacterium]